MCFLVIFRYEDPGDAAAGHAAHAGQRPVTLLFRIFHFWYRGGAIMAGGVETTVCV